jgi:hypothetical protein
VIQQRLERALRLRAVHLLNDLPTLDHAHTGQALNTQVLGQGLVLSDVYQAEQHLTLVKRHQFLEHLPGVTGFEHRVGPEQQQHGRVLRAFNDVTLKGVRRDLKYGGAGLHGEYCNPCG